MASPAPRTRAACIVALTVGAMVAAVPSEAGQGPALECAGPPAANPNMIGTGGDDLLVGSGGPDVILGLRGNDLILAEGGHDVVCGGARPARVGRAGGEDPPFWA